MKDTTPIDLAYLPTDEAQIARTVITMDRLRQTGKTTRVDLTRLTLREKRIARTAVSNYRYRQTPRGKALQRAAYHRYMKTQKGRTTRNRNK